MVESKEKFQSSPNRNGKCSRCHRALKNPKSVINGMGPICATKGHKNVNQNDTNDNGAAIRILDPVIAETFFKQLTKTVCKCGAPISRIMYHYDHPGGWTVLGFQKRQWLFVECADCGYQSSLVKLGLIQD